MPCVTSGIQISVLIATHPEVLGGQEFIPDPVAKLSLQSAYSSGVGNNLADREVCIFVMFAQSIIFESIILYFA